MVNEPTRDEWCRSMYRRNMLAAAFPQGHMMRCVHNRRLNNGTERRCAGELGRVPVWSERAVVRGVEGIPAIAGSRHERRTCPNCGHSVDVYLIRPAESWRATG